MQDFPVILGAHASSSPSFGARLASFLHYLPYEGLAPQELHTVRDHCTDLLADIDFRCATGALVTCMRAQRDHKPPPARAHALPDLMPC